MNEQQSTVQPASQSPFAAPTQPPPTTPPPTAPTGAAPPPSPFSAPAQTAPAPPSAPAGDVGDTSFLDGVTAREPLVKNCTVPGVVTALEVKESTSGNPFLSLAVQLYGNEMKYEDGTPVSLGKRLTSSVFASSKTPEGLQRTGRQLKNTLLALRDVPLDGKEDAAYKAWAPAQKIGLVNGSAFNLAPFRAQDWSGTKVLVEVRKGRDMDGNPRNEFHLLAASTKAVERKGGKPQ